MLKQDAEPSDLVNHLQTFQGNATQLHQERTLSKRMNIYVFTFDTENIDDRAFLEAVKGAPPVLLAQFNHRVELRQSQRIPNDPAFDKKWGLHNTGQTGGTADADIDAPEAWNCVTGGLTVEQDSIVIAIVDGGADIYHEDINYWKNRHEIPGNSADDDNNGYIDDYDGWDAYNSDGSIPDSDHGTHVSGIAGAIGDNDTGVVGVNWNAQIMPIAGSSGDEATVVEAYSYIVDMRVLYNKTDGDSGAFIVSSNSSFGVNYGDPADYPIWCAMYDSMGKVGIISAAATMNIEDDVDTAGDVPTACPSDYLLSVTNTTDNDNKNSFAAYGDTTIDLGAPGTDIYSTESGSDYGYKTGTSMASPQVAGAMALLYAAADTGMIKQYKQNPDSIALQQRELLIQTVDTIPDLQGKTVSEGRLNVGRAVRAIQRLIVSFSYTSQGLTYQFEDTSSTANQYFWQFGDGDTSHSPSPQHTYSDTGTYQVKLIASNNCGSDTVTNTINVNCGVPATQFAHSSDSTSYQVNFDNQSVNCTDFTWFFGDGDQDTLASPSHTYTDTGTYQVKLVGSSLCGKDSITKTVRVECVSPQPDYFTVTTNKTVDFTVEHVVDGQYHWDFGDGDTTNILHPTHTYSEGGMYEACLTIENECDSVTSCQSIVIDAVEELGDSPRELRIYPNPNNGQFVMYAPFLKQTGTIVLFNTLGEQVYHQTITEQPTGKYPLYLKQELSPGVYFLQLRTAEKVWQQKVVVD
jgi:PKD repeat protein